MDHKSFAKTDAEIKCESHRQEEVKPRLHSQGVFPTQEIIY